jgi:hypothetical protein
LKKLAKAIEGEGPDDDKLLGNRDDEENDAIPAGYTYLGQFVDHDLTFDPVGSFQEKDDPDARLNFRTPRFDLDSLYGTWAERTTLLIQRGSALPAREGSSGFRLGCTQV